MTLDDLQPKDSREEIIDIADIHEGVREATGYDRPLTTDVVASPIFRPATGATDSEVAPTEVVAEESSRPDWHLDERTRRVGSMGVAQARATLRAVQPPQGVPFDELQMRRQAATPTRRSLDEFRRSPTWPPDRAS